MKNKYLYISILSLCIAAFTLTSCSTDEYINLEETIINFDGADNAPLVVKVDASTAFTAKTNETWFTVTNVTANSITITAEDNDSGFHRSGKVTISNTHGNQALFVNQSAVDSNSRILRKLRLSSSAISPSGKYAGGFLTFVTEDNSYTFNIIIIEIATGKRYEFDPIDQKRLGLNDVFTVTDQGVLFIEDRAGGCVAFDIATMEYTKPQPPAGFGNFLPKVSQSSADGTKMVGWCQGVEKGLTHPILWENSEPRALKMPEKSFRGLEPWYGVLARGISADGNVAYGTSWEGFDMGLIWWKNGELMGYAGGTDVDTDEPIHKIFTGIRIIGGQEIIETLANGLTCQDENMKASANGKYIAAGYRTEAVNGAEITQKFYPAFFNTETNKTKVFREIGEGTGTAVTNDGIGFTTIGTLGPTSGYVVNIETGTVLGKVSEWITATYGITIPGGYISYSCVGGEVLVGTYPESSAIGVAYKQWYIAPAIKK